MGSQGIKHAIVSFLVALFLCVSGIVGWHVVMDSIDAEPAYAAIKVGGEELKGYEPDDVIQVDEQYNIDASNASNKLEGIVVKLVKMAMPILMVICVALIVYNAARNIVKRPEDRVKMGDLIKNMFINFFFILFAWIIVEGIVFIVTNGELILFATILS